jgi:rubrerythrin
MDKDILQGLKNFDRVWSRVSDAAAGREHSSHMTSNSDAETLKTFIEDESKDYAFYIDLAGKCRASGRTAIMRIASDERRHSKMLQTEYFLLTGDSCVPSRSCPYTDGVLSALRRAYMNEVEGSRKYKKAAQETKIPKLAELYSALSEEEKRHSEVIRELIERAIK